MITSLLTAKDNNKRRPPSNYGAGGGNALSAAITTLENEDDDYEVTVVTDTTSTTRPRTATKPRVQRTAIDIVEDNIIRKQKVHDRFFSVVSDVQNLRKNPIGMENGILPEAERLVQQEHDQFIFDSNSGAIPMTTSDHFLSQTLKSLFLFKPNGHRMMMWDLFVILAIIYSVFDVPLQIGFKSNITPSDGEIGMNYFITAVFFADLVITFNIPFYSRKLDSLIIDRKQIAARYLKIWFWIDLVAALPFEDMLASISTSGQQLRSLKLVRIIRLTRLGKLYKLTKMGAVKDWLDNKNISPAFMNVLLLVLQLTIVSHLTSCFWFFITTSDATGIYQPKVQITDDSVHYPLRTWATEFGNAIDDSLHIIPYQYAEIHSQYIASLYFVFTTLFTVGYGDIHAVNTGERFFTIIIELFAAITFATLIARVKAVVDSQNLLSKSLRAKMEDFKAYLEEKNVNLKLKISAKQAYAYYLKKVPDLGEVGFYEDLPKSIKNHFVQHKFMSEIRQIHYFRNCDINMVADLIVFSQPQQALVGDIIYNIGDYANEIAYLMKGSVRLLDLHGSTSVIMGFSSSGGYFGDFEYFRKSTRITKYQAAQNCNLFTISYEHFDHTLSEYDDQKAKFLRKLGRRFDIWNEVKKSPLLYGTMDDYIGNATEGNQKEKVDKLMCHSCIWTDGEIEQVFADQDVESARHSSPIKQNSVLNNPMAFSAEKARLLMSIKVKLVESLYYNLVTYHGGQKKAVISELPLEYLTANWLLFPGGPLKLIWDSFIGILIFYSVLVIPMQLAFPSFSMASTDPIVPVAYALDFMFLFDMIAAFNTTYYVEEDDAYVCIRTKIAYRYITSWFMVDLLSTVPFDLLVQAANPNSAGNQTIIVQLAKVLRLLRLVKLMKTINFAHLTNIAEDQLAIPAVVFNLLDMFFRVVFISHLVGCFWWGLTYGEIDGPHWFNNRLNTPDNLEWASFQDQYVVSLYWTIQTLTTTGYGDFVPTNDNERVLCLIILVLGATVFSYVVAHISELVQSFNHSEARIANRMTEIKEFLTDARVGSSLFTEVVQHFRQSMKRNSGFDETAILRRLPVRLQDSLMLYHYHELLEMVPIFRHIKNTSIKLFLLKQMRQCSADTGRTLVREDHLATELVFLYKGSASMNKLIMTEQERRLNEKMKYSSLGAALLWCLRAHRTLKMQEEMETDQLELQKRLEIQARQSKELEKMAFSPLPAHEELANSSHPRGTNDLTIEMTNIPQLTSDMSTPTWSSTASPPPGQQRKSSFMLRSVTTASMNTDLIKSLVHRGSDEDPAEVSVDMKEEKLLDKLTATIRGGSRKSSLSTQEKVVDVVKGDEDDGKKGEGDGKNNRERSRINSLSMMAPISEASEAGGTHKVMTLPPVAMKSLSLLSISGSDMRSSTNSPRSPSDTRGRESFASSIGDRSTPDRVYKGNAALKVNPYRVSARAKIRWEKVKMYLGTIVQMGLESKTKSYDVLGTLFSGDMFGYSECSQRATFKCSLVAIEPCSYCTLSVDSFLTIAKEFPGIGMELQATLGSCVAETESKLHHEKWKKQNLDFLQSVRKTLVAQGEEAQRQENELQDRRVASSVSAAMGSMFKKPMTLRFSQKSVRSHTVSQRSVHIDTNPSLNMSSKSDVSSTCDDDQPLLRAPRSPSKAMPTLDLERRFSNENNNVVNNHLSARLSERSEEDGVPVSARAKITNIFSQKKNRIEILTGKLEKMEDFFRKSSLHGKSTTRQMIREERGSSSKSMSELITSLNNSQHSGPIIRNLIRIPSKKIKILKKAPKSNIEPSNVRKKHRSYADAITMSHSKHMSLSERSTEAAFDMNDPDLKTIKKKPVRRNSDGTIDSSHHHY